MTLNQIEFDGLTILMMKNNDQILTEILLTETSDNFSGSELIKDHEWYNKLMQFNLIRENFDIDYETGYFNDNIN
ncbi:MAG: hypothetical protein HC905_27530 [Bacteroidales bacterium]|nr:hypothetical protein [Bacteroidales bacterium]